MLPQANPRAPVAVILNPQARGVRPEVVDLVSHLVPRRDLFISESKRGSREIARTVVERAYPGVLFGGGDGTFVRCLSDIACEAERVDAALPRVGMLRLGSGNALAAALGASRPTLSGLIRDLSRARSSRRNKTLALLRVDGNLTPFAGLGLDAQILDDVRKVVELLDRAGSEHRRRIPPAAHYALAVALRSLPRFLFSRSPEVEVVNTGEVAYRIDQNSGELVGDQPIWPGQTLFRGRVALCSASTIPYYGFGMKMFPYVDRLPGTFQLRCCTASAAEILINLPGAFRGEYRSPKLHDFVCTAIAVQMKKPVPIQIGGDVAEGLRDELAIDLAQEPVHLLA
jgi:diacylglycerol kinase family enzyme